MNDAGDMLDRDSVLVRGDRDQARADAARAEEAIERLGPTRVVAGPS
jgi:hypothetical protein